MNLYKNVSKHKHETFNDENINILEIKDSKCFTHIIKILNEKINGIESNEIFLLDNNENELNMGKEMYMIFDLFNIDYNSKKIISKIYEIISENIKKNQDHEIDICQHLSQYICFSISFEN